MVTPGPCFWCPSKGFDPTWMRSLVHCDYIMLEDPMMSQTKTGSRFIRTIPHNISIIILPHDFRPPKKVLCVCKSKTTPQQYSLSLTSRPVNFRCAGLFLPSPNKDNIHVSTQFRLHSFTSNYKTNLNICQCFRWSQPNISVALMCQWWESCCFSWLISLKLTMMKPLTAGL